MIIKLHNHNKTHLIDLNLLDDDGFRNVQYYVQYQIDKVHKRLNHSKLVPSKAMIKLAKRLGELYEVLDNIINFLSKMEK